MVKQKMFRKQQLTFMVLNLIAFTIIFTIFGLIVFSQVQNTLFSEADEDLLFFKEVVGTKPPADMRAPRQNAPPGPREEQLRNNPNPRIIVLDWNEDGEIINQDEIGTLFYNTYLDNLSLTTSTLNTITSMTIKDEFHFRYLLFEDETDDEVAYTQLLMNVDAEQTIIDNFGRLIVICSLIFIILSISASYVLSKKMMKPIIRSWNKQAEFVENASHELRTPLTIIQNKLELLLTKPEEKIVNKFENIALSLSETRRLSKLTSDLLTLARADSAETELVKQPIELDQFLKSVCAPYIEIAESQDKQFWLNLHGNAFIQADEVRFHQLIVILLDNALKYTSAEDSIGVKTYVQDQKAVLDISDTGIGIKEENLPHVFERFYREDRARSRETGGTGLGLSIAQWIVAKHNGTISATRNEQRGTTFIVKLPKE
ncbi:HAMP domain-containing histidine kinase [Alkalihalobacillus sp. MEB130]|uniref:sensor histidine kinase n=1 Tax=Alkalihalobacillus sp. MEB130 TaxID=2976704 RepID=UPI0028E01785|nr:ATP-binding protein [Alkalihalobacillus sp. MEB130]MDT8862075.1 HAMP domain-containing histidine kinase [Alkalihalobacillus sp. MEB130]